MRCSGLRDELIADLLDLNGEDVSGEPQAPLSAALRERLDRLEKPFKVGRRASKPRQQLAFACRQVSAIRVPVDVRPEDDPGFLRGFVVFLEAHKSLAIAEPQTYGAWIPHFMRDDPPAYIQDEIDKTNARIRELERDAERASRAEAARRLRLGRGDALTTVEYGKLPEKERQHFERAFGLHAPGELQKFDRQFSDDLRSR